jgi:hypothetical protein
MPQAGAKSANFGFLLGHDPLLEAVDRDDDLLGVEVDLDVVRPRNRCFISRIGRWRAAASLFASWGSRSG